MSAENAKKKATCTHTDLKKESKPPLKQSNYLADEMAADRSVYAKGPAKKVMPKCCNNQVDENGDEVAVYERRKKEDRPSKPKDSSVRIIDDNENYMGTLLYAKKLSYEMMDGKRSCEQSDFKPLAPTYTKSFAVLEPTPATPQPQKPPVLNSSAKHLKSTPTISPTVTPPSTPITAATPPSVITTPTGMEKSTATAILPDPMFITPGTPTHRKGGNKMSSTYEHKESNSPSIYNSTATATPIVPSTTTGNVYREKQPSSDPSTPSNLNPSTTATGGTEKARSPPNSKFAFLFHKKDKDKDKGKEREKGKERDKDKEKLKEKEREKGKDKEKDKDKGNDKKLTILGKLQRKKDKKEKKEKKPEPTQ